MNIIGIQAHEWNLSSQNTWPPGKIFGLQVGVTSYREQGMDHNTLSMVELGTYALFIEGIFHSYKE